MKRQFRRQHNCTPLKIFFLILLISATLGAVLTILMESFLQPVVIAAAEQIVTREVTTVINVAVAKNASSLRYTDIIHYETNKQGDIILMQPDLQKVNQFVSQVTISIQEDLRELNEKEIRVPVAQALGYQVLAALGPKMNVKMLLLGVVKPPQIIDSFDAVGINQTRHKIYLHVVSEVQLVVPFVHKKITLETQVPVTEVTIMGKVPEVYVGINGGIILGNSK